MPLVSRSQTILRIQRAAVHQPLPPALTLVFGLFLSIVFTITGMLMLTRWLQPSSNPFAAYMDMLPENALGDVSWSNSEQITTLLGSPCRDVSVSSDCRYTLTSGPIKSVTFSSPYREDEPAVIYLSVRENTLRVGDLCVIWGKPIVITYPNNQFLVTWPNQQITTLVHSKTGNFNFFLPIHYLYITISLNRHRSSLNAL